MWNIKKKNTVQIFQTVHYKKKKSNDNKADKNI